MNHAKATISTPTAPPPPLRIAPPPVDVSELADELDACLEQLHGHVRRLAELSAAKLDLMRSADAAGLQDCACEEGRVLDELGRIEQKRTALFAQLAQALHAPALLAAGLSEIAGRLPGTRGAQLRARASGIRDAAERLQKNNRRAADVARNLHSHIRSVFSELARANQESAVYGHKGQPQPTRTKSWVDAVG
jgi:flagellar biosynthesis/type III secretory pathway chaperone